MIILQFTDIFWITLSSTSSQTKSKVSVLHLTPVTPAWTRGDEDPQWQSVAGNNLSFTSECAVSRYSGGEEYG